jgi:ferredoxin
MKVNIDLGLCDGHGQCVNVAPDVFDLGEDGLAYLKIDPVGEEFRKQVEEAVLMCPPEAISIED